MKLLKWVLGQVATYWIGVLLAAVAAALGVTALVAKEWVERMFMCSLWPVEVPRYVFWPWSALTVSGICFITWAFFRGPPVTAQNFYRSDIVEGFLWRWDVTGHQSNASPYGMVYNLTRYCRKCQSVRFKVDFLAVGPAQALITCENPKCQLSMPVTDLYHLENQVKAEITRMAATNEWKGNRKRIRRADRATS